MPGSSVWDTLGHWTLPRCLGQLRRGRCSAPLVTRPYIRGAHIQYLPYHPTPVGHAVYVYGTTSFEAKPCQHAVPMSCMPGKNGTSADLEFSIQSGARRAVSATQTNNPTRWAANAEQTRYRHRHADTFAFAEPDTADPAAGFPGCGGVALIEIEAITSHHTSHGRWLDSAVRE